MACSFVEHNNGAEKVPFMEYMANFSIAKVDGEVNFCYADNFNEWRYKLKPSDRNVKNIDSALESWDSGLVKKAAAI